ncbi:ABC transporter substrate-binding protein [Camelimonas abortus]|uniref:ABC transporter substrate-binding protein n=1 Tax=Camelimonas abortus TaxID=1017184 RepID=A0ABV7LCQ4_9HYPH
MAAASDKTPAISDDVVRIGLLLDMSGPYADITGRNTVVATQMAIEDFGGKVLGKNIELVYADTLNKPDITAARAREWFDAQNVDALMDVAATAPSLAALEIARARNKIVAFTSPASARLTNEACSPVSVHWTYDTYALAHGTGRAAVRQGYDTWFFVTADYTFGTDLERDVTKVVQEGGGKVLGSVRAPLNTLDFSSFLLQAQASKAKIIGLANAGNDTVNSIKQAQEFGIVQGGQKLAGMLIFLSDIHSLGLDKAHGLVLTTAFYWDRDEESRKWAKRFFERTGRMPSMSQAGAYSATMHYLKAIEATGTDDTDTVMKKMRETPVNDFFARNGRIREDGRMVHDMYLAEVKSPSESKGPWDYYRILQTIPADEAFQPLSESRCPLVKQKS